MKFEDRAHDAARDLRKQSATVPPPGIREKQRSIPPVAFAAGFAAVVLLVLIPLTLLGGPREGEEPAILTTTTTVVSTTTMPPSTTTTTSLPGTTQPVDPAVGTVVIPNLSDLVAPVEDFSVAARFEWGDQVGTNEKGVGPCCFDVASDGTVVIVDAANLRLVASSPRLSLRVIAEWEAGDFVPHAILIKPQPQNDIIHVLGMTNEPGRPNDLITMTMDGTVIDRGSVDVDFNAEMVVSAGQVWAESLRGARTQWVRIAGEVGDVFPMSEQILQERLLLGDRGSLDLVGAPQRTGITVELREPDGSGVDVEIDYDTETWGHQVLPFFDGFVVIARTSEIELDGGVGRIAAVFDSAGNLVEGLSWQGSFYAEVGPFGLATLRNGAIYEMHSTVEAVEIRRYPLVEARAADALAARLADARAIDRAGQWTWIATAPDNDGNSEILKLNNNAELLAAYEVPGEVTALDAEGPEVWYLARDPSGELIGTVSIGTGEGWAGEIYDFPGVEILAGDRNAWVLFRSDQTGTSGLLAVTSPELSGDREATFLPDTHTPIGMVSVDETLWIATQEGSLLRYDTSGGTFLEDIDVGTELVDISVVSDVNDRFGHAIWVAGADGSLHRYDSDDGTKTSTYQLEGRPLLVQNPIFDIQYVVLENGDVFVAGEDWGPEPVLESGARSVNAARLDGRLWLLGESLVVISFAG
jgi:hypothetical protein